MDTFPRSRYYKLTGKPKSALICTALFLAIMPLVVLLVNGTLAGSVSVGLACVAFYFTIQRATKAAFLKNFGMYCSPCFAAFVFAVAYLQYRDAFRMVLWSGGAVESALETVDTSQLKVENSTNFTSLYQIRSGDSAAACLDGAEARNPQQTVNQ